jgi:phenylacetic acid degradation operon negative regulatory protein
MKQKTKRNEIAMHILLTIGLVGIFVVGVTVPNLLQLIPRGRHSKEAVRHAVRRLDKKGHILAIRQDKGWRISLSQRGREELLKYEHGLKKLKKIGTWDGKWRLLIFDIPEQKRHLRDKLRSLLNQLGFIQLQKSVWTYPWECQDVLHLIRVKYKLHQSAIYLRTEYAENDLELRRHFHLV